MDIQYESIQWATFMCLCMNILDTSDTENKITKDLYARGIFQILRIFWGRRMDLRF